MSDIDKIRPILTGQKTLVVGVANEHSIAYGCACAFRAAGSDLALSWLNEKARPHVEPLAEALGAAITGPLDVSVPGQLEAFFEVRVDGHMIHAQHLAGKPAPDTFVMAARLLGVEPTRAVVIEDAIAGVQAGCTGHFGLVIGVARKGNADELRRHGAHLVVNDLGELVG